MKLRNKSLGEIGRWSRLQSLARWMPLLLGIGVLGASAAAQNQSVPEKGEGNPTTQNHANNDKSGGTGEETEGDPVEISTGAFAFSKKVFELPGRDNPLSITLGYVSNNQGIETQTGARWTHDFEEKLVVQYTWLAPIEPYPGPAEVWSPPHGEPFAPEGLYTEHELRPLLIEVFHYHDLRVDFYRRSLTDVANWIPTQGQFTKLRSENIMSGPYSLPQSFILRNPDGSKTYFPASLWEGGCGIYTFRAGITQDSKGNTVTRGYESLPKSSGCPGGEGQFYRRLSTVTDNYGRVINFDYDTVGWLNTITDFAGRAVVLEHDAIGNITAINQPTVTTLPPISGASGYTIRTEIEYTPLIPGYPHSQHNIHRVYAPTEVLAGGTNKIPYVVNSWDPTGERVTSQFVGGTNATGIPAGGTYAYLLEVLPTPIFYGWFDCARRTLIVDPDGKVQLHLFDAEFRPRLVYSFTGYLEPTAITPNMAIDPLVVISPATPSVADGLASPSVVASGSSDPPVGCHWKRMDYDSNINLIALELTQDSRTEYVYDVGSPDRFQQCNLLVMKQIANDGSGAQVRHGYVYDPLYNRTRREYDPRAFGGYTPPNGGAFTSERYSVLTSYDYQEAQQSALQSEIDYWLIDMTQSSAISTLGAYGITVGPITFGSDLNQNGIVDGLGGSVVQTSRTVRTYLDPVANPPVFGTLVERTRHQYNSFGLLTRTIDPAGYKTNYTYYSAGSSPNDPSADPSSAAEGGFLATVTGFSDIAATEASTSMFGYDMVGRVVLARNARGFDTLSVYDELDRLVSSTDAMGTVRGWLFDPNGNPTREVLKYRKPEMNQATGEPNGTLSATRDILTSMSYDILDHVVSREVQNDPIGGKSLVKYRYTKAGSRVLTLYPEWGAVPGNVASTFFDEFGRTWTSTKGGITTQFASHPSTAAIPERSSIPVDVVDVTATTKSFYDKSRLGRLEDEELHSTQYLSDAFNRQFKSTDPLGNYLLSTFDSAGREIVTARYALGGALIGKVSSSYDERGQVFETRTDHFAHGGLAVGDGFSTKREKFDVRGLSVTSVDDNGKAWTVQYDGLERVTQSSDPLGNYSLLKYDRNGNHIYTDAYELETDSPSTIHRERTWKFHDPIDRVSAIVNELGHATRALYDAGDRIVFQSDARALSINVPLASLDSSTHPQHGDLSTGPAVNSHGNTVWHDYDDQGYLVKTTRHQRAGGLGGNALLTGNAREIVTTKEYDLNGSLSVERDDSGNPTTHAYDSLNRLSQTTYANQTISTRTYYKTGLLKHSVDPNGTHVDYQYDASNRLTWETVGAHGSNLRGTLYSEYQYDAAHRVTLARNADATVTREYDSLSQLSAEVLNGKRTEIRRDGTGALTGYTYPSTRVLGVQTDAIGRLRSVGDVIVPPTPPVATWEYRGSDAVKTQTLKNGVVGTTGFDDIWRPTTRTFVAGSTSLESRGFAWDRESNKTTRTDVLQSNRTFVYSYDSAARMTQSSRTGGGQGSLVVSYGLDDVGNRNSVGNGPDAGAYTMNSSDSTMNAYSTTPFDSRGYDGNGNLSSTSTSLALYYDYRDRLVEYHDNSLGRHHYYSYDAFGRRVQKLTDAGTGAQKRVKYFYDGGWRICEERTGADAVLATYVNGTSLDDVVSMRRDVDGNGTPEDYYYHSDDLANVLSVSNAAGGIAERYEYRDYGQVVDRQNLVPLTASVIKNTRLFTGRELDWETGLYYYRNRYYDPRAGRFISRDPIGAWSDSINVGNAYSYCGSNPWTYIDPLGLDSDLMGDCDSHGSVSDTKADSGSKKGDCESHGSVSDKKDKSGKRISDADYDKQKKGRYQAARAELKRLWEEAKAKNRVLKELGKYLDKCRTNIKASIEKLEKALEDAGITKDMLESWKDKILDRLVDPHGVKPLLDAYDKLEDAVAEKLAEKLGISKTAAHVLILAGSVGSPLPGDEIFAGAKWARRGAKGLKNAVMRALGIGADDAARAALQPSARQIAKFERQLAEHGPGSLQKSQRSIEGRLQEHLQKLEDIRKAGGHTSSVEKEISNFRRELEAIRRAQGGS